MEFQEFPKIARLSRNIIVTEKIDGTNAAVVMVPEPISLTPEHVITRLDDVISVYAQSRTRFITPGDDNFGFALWVLEHAEELYLGLGEGRHFGEWWGNGIQRGYGLGHKRFSLFNTSRWNCENTPDCCDVVPVLCQRSFSEDDIEDALTDLAKNGSMASPGFMKPEGVVIYHTAANIFFKKTLEKDAAPKSSFR